MNPFRINARKAQVIPFAPALAGIVRIKVFADQSLNVYVLDAAGRERYSASAAELRPLAQSSNGSRHELTASVPAAPWFLVLENTSGHDLNGVYLVDTPMVGGSSGPIGPTGAGPMAVGGGWRTF